MNIKKRMVRNKVADSQTYESDLLNMPIDLKFEPYLLTESDSDALWLLDIEFDNLDDDIVTGSVSLEIDDYTNIESEYGEADSEIYTQGFKIRTELLDARLHSQYKGDRFIDFEEDSHIFVRLDDGVEYSKEADVALRKAIVALCLQQKSSLISDSKKINDAYAGDWTLWTYDVWGNEEDGFEVNDTYKVVDKLTIDIETITDEEILDLLKEFNVVDESATLDDIYIDYMSDAIYVDEADTRKPLCGIVMND